jgi:hypothetical protein
MTQDAVQKVFYSALIKAAAEERPEIASVAALRKRLRKGDILISTPKPLPAGTGLAVRAADAVRREILRSVQDSEHVHSMIYAGDGKVLDLRFDGVSNLPLNKAVAGMGIIAVRPQVSPEAKTKAVSKIERVAKDVVFSPLGLLRPAISRVVPLTKEKTRKLEESVCSTLISKAFDKKVVPGKARDAVMPVDFIRSPRTLVIGELRKES